MELLGRECDGKQGWREDDVGGSAGPVALGVEDGGLAAAVEMDSVTIIMVKLSGPQTYPPVFPWVPPEVNAGS